MNRMKYGPYLASGLTTKHVVIVFNTLSVKSSTASKKSLSEVLDLVAVLITSHSPITQFVCEDHLILYTESLDTSFSRRQNK